MDTSVRSELLKALNDATTAYVAASISLSKNDTDPLMTKMRRHAAVLSFMCCFDATMRSGSALPKEGSLASV